MILSNLILLPFNPFAIVSKDPSKLTLPEIALIATGIIHNNKCAKHSPTHDDTSLVHLKKIKVTLLDIVNENDERVLLIQKQKSIIGRIDIPTQKKLQGFSVNWIKEIKQGFEISIEYGGAKIYHQKDFRFQFREGNFVLTNLALIAFDKQNPENKKSYTNKTNVFKVPIKLKDFKFENFL